MPNLLPLLAALLVATADGATPPASEVQVERFLAAIPDADQLHRIDRSPDPIELARLGGFNPGREDEIEPVLEAFAACSSPIANAMGLDGLRFIARGLGSEKLGQLISFYEGDDFRRFSALAPRVAAGETLAPPEQAEFDRIMAGYPLEDFNRAMQDQMPEFFASQTERMGAIDRCRADKDAALARLGVDTVGPDLTPVPPPNPVPNAGQ